MSEVELEIGAWYRCESYGRVIVLRYIKPCEAKLPIAKYYIIVDEYSVSLETGLPFKLFAAVSRHRAGLDAGLKSGSLKKIDEREGMKIEKLWRDIEAPEST